MQQSQSQTDTPLGRLAELIRIKTESSSDYSKYDMAEFARFREVFARTYPRAFTLFEEIDAGPLAMVFCWPGRNPELKPALFIGHFDVVGAEADKWSQPPFEGLIENDYLYGRGTLDIKQQLAGYMEAVQNLAAGGFSPERTLYFAFGGDEEAAGLKGAGRISALFEEQGLQFEFVLDEGGIISTDNMKAFTSNPVALIGIEEKGMFSLQLRCSGDAGHSSMPPRQTAIGRVAEAVRRIERAPFPPRLINSVSRMLKEIGRNSTFPYNLLFNLMPLTNGLILKAFSASNATNSLIRTSQAVTLISGGMRENVLPSRAETVINFRILPGETMESVQGRIKKIVKDPGIVVEPYDGWPPNDPIPAPVSDTEAFSEIKETVREVFPGCIPVPFLVNGSTDSKYYRHLSENIFRFTPVFMAASDLERIHGVDERISAENMNGIIRFYERFMQKTCG